MSNSDGLIASYLLDGHGGGEAMQWDDINSWAPEHGVLWVHLDYTQEQSKNWIINISGLDEITSEALLAQETRPRTADIEGGLLVILRGVNLNPGADPEDMVAIRVWTDGRRIISSTKRPLISIPDLCKAIQRKRGPVDVGDFFVILINSLTDRTEDVIDTLSDRIDELEEQVLAMETHQLRPSIANIRREAIALRRYLAPQREALSHLYQERMSWLQDNDRMRLRECSDQVLRLLEELDSVRERAIVTQEELMSRLSEHMEKRMYILSLVAALFLPLGFLTGLLGVNVAGIPGANDQHAFMIFTVSLIVLVVIQLWIFKRKKWM